MSFIDSLRTAFKGGGGVAVPLARGIPTQWLWSEERGGARQPFDYRSAVHHAFLDNPVAQRAVRIVAEGVGNAPVSETTPEIAALLRGGAEGGSLMETLAAHLLLHGNAFVQIGKGVAGCPASLFALRPERVSVIAGNDGWPVAYRYRVGEKVRDIPVEDEDGWPALIHLKAFHPADDHYGAGCLSAAGPAVAIHNEAARWNLALLENAARPSGALVYDNGVDTAGLTSDQFERLKAELASAYQGGGNAGRPMLLEGGLKWQSLSLSPADMDFAELKAAAARDIALAFGVPPMLLGLPGDNTYSNYREANRALWRLTLLPLAGKILGGLANGLAPWFPDASLSIDLDQVPALSEDREKLWKQVSEADFLSNDEKRAMLGLAPANPGDVK
ncbi:phage portal protein [Aurantiacibacter poecillastricola]|uniref:phage portal protein n=1 Tax=Aurantiacibacter poecillastricola TaxID=3064385 RepID=UPI00273EA081|nr:phage portal protein [Aurantiacibacter sp. 219JJ12-13]MDP5260305.1 phage portal protein [Aurantiacibacter sp. 219JJ12-13]